MDRLSNENLLKIKGKCGIYKIVIGKHFYIGSSNNIMNRLRNHRNSLINKCHHNHTMQNCFNKYGLEALLFEVVEECSEAVILDREAYYINTLQPDMNHILDPTRPSPDQETIKRAIETRKQNNLLLNRRAGNIKKVFQYDIDGNFIKEWDAASDAAAFYECEVTALCACCNGRAITCCGFQWSYTKEEKTKPVKNWRGNVIIQYDRNMNPIMAWNSFADIRKELHIEHLVIKRASDTASLYKDSYWVVNPEQIEDFENLPIKDNPALKCKKWENNNPVSSKRVYQYDIYGNYLTEYPSVSEAARCLNVDSRGIGLCASDGCTHYKSAYGYRWSYIKQERLPEYTNNSSKAVCKQVFIFDVLTGEEKQFDSVAEAVRFYNSQSANFDSDCASLSACANKSGYFLNRYLAKRQQEDTYVLPSTNLQIYNSVSSKLYSNAKEAGSDTGISSYVIKKLCKNESNKEWLYINQCARVKLRESGKLFV